jgi:hypothetical protein
MRHKWPALSLTRQIQSAFAVAAIVHSEKRSDPNTPPGAYGRRAFPARQPTRVASQAGLDRRVCLVAHSATPPLKERRGRLTPAVWPQGIRGYSVDSGRVASEAGPVRKVCLVAHSRSPPCASDGRGSAPTIRGATRANAHRHRVHRRLYNTPNLAVEKKPASRRAPDLLAMPHSRGVPLNNSLMTWRMRISCASDRTPVLIFTVKLFTSLVMLPA